MSSIKWLTVCILLVGSQAQQNSFSLADFGDFFTAPLSSAPASQVNSQPAQASQFQPQPASRSQFQPQPVPFQFQNTPSLNSQFRNEASIAGGSEGDNRGFSFPAALPYVHDSTGDAPSRKQQPGPRNRPQQQQQQPQQQQPQPQQQQQQQPQPQQQGDQFTLARKQWEAQVAKHKQISQKHISKVNAIVNDQEKLHQTFLSSEEGIDLRNNNVEVRREGLQNNNFRKEERIRSKESKPVHLSQFLSKTTRAHSQNRISESVNIPEEIVEDIEENVVLIEELARAVNDLADLVLNVEAQNNRIEQRRTKENRKIQHRNNRKFQNRDERIPQELKERKNFIKNDRKVLRKHRNVNTKKFNNEFRKQKEAIVNEVIDHVIDEQTPKRVSNKRIRNRGLNIRG